MNIETLVNNMTPELYERLSFCAETGKWPDGSVASEAQRGHAVQLVMAYQAKHLDSDQMMTVGSNGELVTKSKSEIKAQFVSSDSNDSIATFKNDEL
ncbi:YeaC family protein [Thalassotalea agarivorans]|uniref:DUF1315 domain-containing protein n=1 Tax=Thalassotalea agarivorans TaxID=349064 RepID=A0A1I0D9B2_THASX|nr:DUF1315 family protein [Thalassotalea agarivorans]SET28508.1 hypothetical protein SAMN05660429_01415 [Thalassotalea agarivorans]